MATIKSYTDISQSKTLSKILPLESADMYYPYNGIETYPEVKNGLETETALYCWSLAALLSVLPKGTNISNPDTINKVRYSCWNDYDITYADNPVDACYEMALKLHELKML